MRSRIISSPLIKLDINAAGPLSGKTALHVAVEKNHIEIIKFLLEKSADSTRRDKDGKIPEDYVTTEACRRIFLELVDLSVVGCE
jgi:ankyrin repeat protein